MKKINVTTSLGAFKDDIDSVDFEVLSKSYVIKKFMDCVSNFRLKSYEVELAFK